VELTLNLVWAAVAAIFLLLGGIGAFFSPRRHGNFSAAVALVCIICFLFPVISISDDLNNSPPLGEPGKSKKSFSTNDLTDARLLSTPEVPFHTGPVLQHGTHFRSKIPASRERIWFNLDRRPPPQR